MPEVFPYDENLTAYDNSAQSAMRAKATYIGCVAKLTNASGFAPPR